MEVTRNLEDVAQAHSFETKIEDGVLYVLVHWSKREEDGSFTNGADWEPSHSFSELLQVMGY